MQVPTPRPAPYKPGKARLRQGATASTPQPPTLSGGPASLPKTLPSTSQIMSATSLGQNTAGKQSGDPPPTQPGKAADLFLAHA